MLEKNKNEDLNNLCLDIKKHGLKHSCIRVSTPIDKNIKLVENNCCGVLPFIDKLEVVLKDFKQNPIRK